jgi:prepilin-type N-terminal cleavage/methylation domain-containing protein/prepilin-type processing-associated H-X9-DG protein
MNIAYTIQQRIYERKSTSRLFKRKIFTLLELLVVIAIISILASLLLPALKAAKEKGNSIKCRGNLKQIAYAYFLYIQDANGWIPTTLNENHTRTPWYRAMLPYLDSNATDDSVGIKRCSRFTICPSDSSPEMAWGYELWSYGANVYLGDDRYDPHTAQGCKKYNYFRSPSLTACVADNYNRVFSTMALSDIEYRHNGGINVVHLDGHVDRYKYPVPTLGNDSFWGASGE